MRDILILERMHNLMHIIQIVLQYQVQFFLHHMILNSIHKCVRGYIYSIFCYKYIFIIWINILKHIYIYIYICLSIYLYIYICLSIYLYIYDTWYIFNNYKDYLFSENDKNELDLLYYKSLMFKLINV